MSSPADSVIEPSVDVSVAPLWIRMLSPATTAGSSSAVRVQEVAEALALTVTEPPSACRVPVPLATMPPWTTTSRPVTETLPVPGLGPVVLMPPRTTTPFAAPTVNAPPLVLIRPPVEVKL